MALIQGMENANKTRARFGWCANGGFLEGAGRVPFAHSSAWMTAIGGTCQYSFQHGKVLTVSQCRGPRSRTYSYERFEPGGSRGRYRSSTIHGQLESRSRQI